MASFPFSSVLILLDDSKIKTMIQIVRSTVQTFRQPGTIARMKRKWIPLVLLLDVNTRWNPTYCMIKRYKRMFQFVKQAAEELNMHVTLINDDFIE
jgi:hypothetical protein